MKVTDPRVTAAIVHHIQSKGDINPLDIAPIVNASLNTKFSDAQISRAIAKLVINGTIEMFDPNHQ